jgi:phosphomannomutase
MQSSGVAFGTSGTRGLVVDMTDEVCISYVTAFLAVMQRTFQFTHVALGMDLRPSSPAIAAACAQAIQNAGFIVDFCGALPTPALALYGLAQDIPAIMVTGSHIPFDRNGIKFYRPDGEIDKADELAISTQTITLDDVLTVTALPSLDTRAIDSYQQRYLDFFPSAMLAGLRLGVYEHSSVARDSLRVILTQLGAEVMSLGRTDVFVPIDTEAVSAEDAARGQAWAMEYGFDAIISTDGDGDRPLMSDERGNWLRGDIVGLLCARYLGVQHLAIPVSCNTAVTLSGAFASVIRTKIGSPYVIAGMEQLAQTSTSIAGFEANGGFLLGTAISLADKTLSPLPTRDAVLPVLAVLAAARLVNTSISTLVANLPQRYTASDRLQNIPTAISQRLLADWTLAPMQLIALLGIAGQITQVDTTDGLRISLDSTDIIHLRPSGNAPELRCYCESTSPANAWALTQKTLAYIAHTAKPSL